MSESHLATKIKTVIHNQDHLHTRKTTTNCEQVGRLFPVTRDFPKPGVHFRDPRPFFQSEERLHAYKQFRTELFKPVQGHSSGNTVPSWFNKLIADAVANNRPIVCAMLGSRGYLLTEMLSYLFADSGVRYRVLPVAKASDKLTLLDEAMHAPVGTAGTLAANITTEYSQDTLHINAGALHEGDIVLGFDDMLVTGGSATSLLEFTRLVPGTKVAGFLSLLEIQGEGGRQRLLDKGIPFASIYSISKVSPYADEEVQSVHSGWLRATSLDKGADLFPKMQYSMDGRVSVSTPAVIPTTSHLSQPCVVFASNAQRTTATRMCSYCPAAMRLGMWTKKTFPDGFPDGTIEDQDQLQSDQKDLVWLGALSHTKDLFEQNSVLTALVGQPSRSCTADYPYIPTATHERAKQLQRTFNPLTGRSEFLTQDVATADTFFHALGGAVKKNKLLTLNYFDIHDVHLKFYSTPSVLATDVSMIPVLLAMLRIKYSANECKHVAIAFPDSGAQVRFGPYFADWMQVICHKKRVANERNIDVEKELNMREDRDVRYLIIVDDLVHTGGTLLNCAQLLVRRYQATLREVMGYCTHAIFDNHSERRFLHVPGRYRGKRVERMHKASADASATVKPMSDYGPFRGFDLFFVSNSNPEVAARLQGRAPFVVLDIAPVLFERHVRQYGWTDPYAFPHIARHLKTFYGPKYAFVGSRNRDKVQAVQLALTMRYPFASRMRVDSCDSESRVHEQPVGATETLQGASTRFQAVREHVSSLEFDSANTWLVAMESGILRQPGVSTDDPDSIARTQADYQDQACIVVSKASIIEQQAQRVAAYAWSTPAHVDHKHYAVAQKSGFETTCGTSIAQEIAEHHGDGYRLEQWQSNWHSFYGYLPRAFQMASAIYAAIDRIDFASVQNAEIKSG
jgi:adenine/guanine phosphoribosyltransferase-like PRPP-binding protein